MDAIHADARFDNLDLDAIGHSGLAKENNLRSVLSAIKQAIRVKIATSVGLFFFFYVTVTLQTFASCFLITNVGG